MQLTRTLYVLCAGVRHDTGLWTFVLWTLLSCVRINGCVPALILKHSRSCYYFRGCVCTDFRCVQRRRSGGSTTYKVQPRRHEGVRQTWRALQLIARLCETCMHRTSTLVLGIGVAFARSNSWNGLVGVSLLPKSLPFHRSCHAQRLFFPRFPLVSEPLTFPSPAGIPVLHSRVLQTKFGRSHPKNSNWEGNIHCAHVQA